MVLFNSSASGFLLNTMLYLSNFSDKSPNNTLEDFKHLPIGADSDLNKPKCYGVYGCFSNDKPWTTEKRLISLYPESPLKINPRYPVFTKDTRIIPRFLDLNEPRNTRSVGINRNGNIYFVAHGYLESGDRPWIQDMVNSLLDADTEQKASVIIVDWGGGSSPPYAQAVANIRLVGAITAHIIHMIYDELKLANLDRVHMLGHSLGAHLSGYTGYTLSKDFGLHLGRITGLDPAEPLFSDTDAEVRLDRTDAQFVDVIHTDAQPLSSGGNSTSITIVSTVINTITQPYNPYIGLGMRMPIGHVDFYPNGGYNNPGCDASMQDYIQQEKGSFFWGIQQFLSCNHIRSHQFMAESLRSRCPLMGITCESWEAFKEGSCFECNADGHQCIAFGMAARDSYQHQLASGHFLGAFPTVQVYLMNTLGAQHCRAHYKVTVQVSASMESVLHGGEVGTMSMTLHTHIEGRKKVDSEEMSFTPEPLYYEPGTRYVSVISGRDVGNVTHATVYWTHKTNPLNPLTWRILATPRVYVQYLIIETLNVNRKLKYCAMYSNPVASGSSQVFNEEYCDSFASKPDSEYSP